MNWLWWVKRAEDVSAQLASSDGFLNQNRNMFKERKSVNERHMMKMQGIIS